MKSTLLKGAALLTGVALLLTSPAAAQGPIQQAGFGMHGGGPMQGFGQHLRPYGACPPGAACPEKTFEYIPEDRHPPKPEFLSALNGTMKSGWFRIEYLNWNIENPGRRLIGAPRASGGDRTPFDVTDPISQINVGFGTQPNMENFDLDNNNGLRFAFGIPSRIGDFEASVFILDQASDSKTQDPVRRFDLAGDLFNINTPNFFAVTPVTVDGFRSDNATLVYSNSYRATIKSDTFGTEANWVMNPLTPNQPLSIRPLIGFQYLNLRDHFLIAGQDQRDLADPTTLLNHRIDSRSKNNIFAPQIGVRAEFVHEWFTVSATPKFLLGFNRRHDSLTTQDIFIQNDGRFQQEEATEFSPSFDLKVDGRVHLNEHFSLFVSYQLYVISNVSRGWHNVNYDSLAGPENNISLTPRQQQWMMDGITVGGELRFH